MPQERRGSVTTSQEIPNSEAVVNTPNHYYLQSVVVSVCIVGLNTTVMHSVHGEYLCVLLASHDKQP